MLRQWFLLVENTLVSEIHIDFQSDLDQFDFDNSFKPTFDY